MGPVLGGGMEEEEEELKGVNKGLRRVSQSMPR